MKIKKTALCLVLIAGIAASLSSCFSTHELVVDEKAPAAHTALVTFANDRGDFNVILWNEKDIESELYGKEVHHYGLVKLTVPAGRTSFLFDVHYTIRMGQVSTTYIFNNIEIRYDLEPGKEYTINIHRLGKGFIESTFFIGIYDAAGNVLKEWELKRG
ncbi:MAG: hypothetical protein LBU85_07980 [Treponema sp.]|jgi:hypothetical protein|nr:hypothetical protein [Treponema sp.]